MQMLSSDFGLLGSVKSCWRDKRLQQSDTRHSTNDSGYFEAIQNTETFTLCAKISA